jgi:enoyl-CoA hydratase/carnithine racemase
MTGRDYSVLAEDQDNIRVLTLNRPEKLNAFTAPGYYALAARLNAAAADPGIAAVVLTGAGRAFSAGVDLTEMGRPNGATELGQGFDPLMVCLATFPKPLLAAVNGLAVGFGATILLHCDLVVVDEAAQIRMPFITLGTCAEAASSWLLPQRVGLQQATFMVLTGAPLDADAAVTCGFALAKAAPGQAVTDTLALARSLARHAVPALIANKALLRHGRAEAIDEVWQREKAAMQAIAVQLGPIGWGGAS